MMKSKKIEKIRNEATSRVNKQPLVQFRIEPEIMDRLYEEANKLGLPVGTMVRMWVMERLNEKSA
jgi:antitoxin component of RelBE/YafQ-DinJ toxin-antitoxin module